MKFRTLAIVVALAAAALAHAQQYRWIDEKGRVQYGDIPPPPSAKGVQKKDLRGSVVESPGSYQLERALKASPVTLYTHPSCADACQMGRDVLKRRGIPYREVSVVDEAAQKALQAVSGAVQVPVLVVGQAVETTISAEAYEQALDAAGYPRTAPPVAARAPAEDAAAKPGAQKPAAPPPVAAEKPGALPAVKLYSGGLCGPLCDNARKHLESRNVAFEELFVDKPEALAELKSLAGSEAVPVLVVGKGIYRGYLPELFDQALDAAGFPPPAPAGK